VVESERGLPYYEADNGYGIPVTFGDSGIPLGGPWPPAPPAGFVYLLGADGAYLKGADGAYLLGAA
jgi:hypothetical protein